MPNELHSARVAPAPDGPADRPPAPAPAPAPAPTRAPAPPRASRLPSRPVRLVAIVSLGALLLSAALAVLLWAEGHAARADALRRELDKTHFGIAALLAENAALERETAALRDDPVAIEHAAREVLGVTRPGDVVLFLEAKP